MANKTYTTGELRKKSLKELHNILRELVKKIAQVRVNIALKKEKNTNAEKNARREIARIKTVMSEKRLLELLKVK